MDSAKGVIATMIVTTWRIAVTMLITRTIFKFLPSLLASFGSVSSFFAFFAFHLKKRKIFVKY